MVMMVIVRNYYHRGGHKHIIVMTVMHNDATCSKQRAGADHENQFFHDLVYRIVCATSEYAR